MNELGRLIARRIALTGPIPVADFMAEALGHPRLGYYRRAAPLGAAGDFVTAPEISQMFGELLGAWLAERWLAMGSPAVVRLVELGPGRGSLMADALRATRGVPGFHAALDLHLVEINATLRAAQQATLAIVRPTWHERFDDVPNGPLLLIANEFFDALPVRQFEKTARGWAERMVGLASDGETLAFALAPGVSPFSAHLPDAAAGAQAEICEAGQSLAAAIGARLRRDGGWALSSTTATTTATALPCKRYAAIAAPVSSTIPARPTSAPMSTLPRWPPRRGRESSGRSGRAIFCSGSASRTVRKP